MCGILLTLGETTGVDLDTLRARLRERGPDCMQTVSKDSVSLTASVLHIRGQSLVQQPITGPRFWLAWNGEAFTSRWAEGVNDTTQVYQELESSQDLASVLEDIAGPYAVVLVDWTDGCVYFGRDLFGQRSLMMWRGERGIVICSGSDGKGEWTEVETGRLFRLNLQTYELTTGPFLGTTSKPSLLRFAEDVENYSEYSLEQALTMSVNRLCHHSHLAVLFSGGLDSTLVTALAAQSPASPSTLYLLNVSFSPDSPDRLTAVYSYRQLVSLYPNKTFKLICIDPSSTDITTAQQVLPGLIYPKRTQMDISITAALWFASRGTGQVAQLPVVTEAFPDLFEGNEGKELTAHQSSDFGLSTRELPFLPPESYLSSAFESYPGRVILSGLGADELCGGYSRYRTAYQSSGNKGLIASMSEDIDRLWERNLGRDDRVTASHSRECLYPFLASEVLTTLSKLPLTQVCNLSRVRGWGDKLILRQLAHKLGLTLAAGFEKRAIQFGSRAAQLYNCLQDKSNRESKGTDEARRGEFSEEDLTWAVRKTLLRLCYEGENAQQVALLRALVDQNCPLLAKRQLMKSHFGDLKAKIRKTPLSKLDKKLSVHPWQEVLCALQLSPSLTGLV